MWIKLLFWEVLSTQPHNNQYLFVEKIKTTRSSEQLTCTRQWIESWQATTLSDQFNAQCRMTADNAALAAVWHVRKSFVSGVSERLMSFEFLWKVSLSKWILSKDFQVHAVSLSAKSRFLSYGIWLCMHRKWDKVCDMRVFVFSPNGACWMDGGRMQWGMWLGVARMTAHRPQPNFAFC